MSSLIYPGISDRIKAVFVDSLVLILLVYLAAVLFKAMNYQGETLRILAFVFIFMLYEPLFVYLFKGSIGHHIMNLKVVRNRNNTQRILLVSAIFRYILKVLLGAISLLTVTGNEKGQAIHDKLTGAVVMYKTSV